MRGHAGLLLVLFPLVTGCIAGDDVDSLARLCKSGPGAPAPAYTAASLEGLVQVPQGLDPDTAVLMLERVASRMIAPARAPYDALETRFYLASRHETGSVVYENYVFEANGTWSHGVDAFYEAFTLQDGAIIASPELLEFRPPGRVLHAAESIARAHPDVESLPSDASTLAASLWDPRMPGCVELRYGSPPRTHCVETDTGSPTCGHTAPDERLLVWVSLVRDEVVRTRASGT